MTQCKALLENGHRCQMTVMMAPDKSQPLVYFLDKQRNISTVGWPLKPADHGKCYYHHNQALSSAAMEQKRQKKERSQSNEHL